MKIAVLGGGMVGLCYTQAFLEQGHVLAGLCDVHPGPAAMQTAVSAGTAIHAAPGNWLAQADAVISAVFGTAALPLFEACLPHLRPGTLYVDMTTADPGDMQTCAAMAHSGEIKFVDVAITGAVNLGGPRTPLLLAGDAAPQVEQLFKPLGAPLRIVGHEPGQAASLKLLRSIFTKGLEALSVECLVTAQAMGLSEQLHEVLQDIDQTPLRTLMESMVRTHIPHSARRRNEVAEARLQMERQGLSPLVSPGVQALFAATAQAQAIQPIQGDSLQEAIAWLRHQVLARQQA